MASTKALAASGFDGRPDPPDSSSSKGISDMKVYRFLPCIASAIIFSSLAGCATTDPGAGKAIQPRLDKVLAQADAASKAGQYEQAQTILKGAGSAFPADKTPWLHLAQMKFDRGNYGDAINHALEVLQRDPDDKVASSIVAVSGLRLSGKALADLSRQNNLNASLRSEVQDLAKLVRSSLGEEAQAPRRVAPARRTPLAGSAAGPAVTNPAAASARPAAPASNDPFSGLK
ncbi:tetratricopeptide repeat protein [Janthinobacterium agaricidamnosum]|uniref:Tetratricopeptide repeat family protein n=1 Tax=Janthinobacterium agaricidamnosum NBRC 102515 = DSM 9628 TaxID=1349767 RepID=W0V9K6_9BURK|nr:tetratricopeptide repeat protein [Janthinobacterium agaricidamnosum]CDG84028.1 tetratricopeptide repeat family protein [Janthinobacterium agaricidamnosum NBRC 102515 = DSM 9628]